MIIHTFIVILVTTSELELSFKLRFWAQLYILLAVFLPFPLISPLHLKSRTALNRKIPLFPLQTTVLIDNIEQVRNSERLWVVQEAEVLAENAEHDLESRVEGGRAEGLELGERGTWREVLWGVKSPRVML